MLEYRRLFYIYIHFFIYLLCIYLFIILYCQFEMNVQQFQLFNTHTRKTVSPTIKLYYLFIYIFIYLFIYIFIYLFIYLFIHLFIYLFVQVYFLSC